MSAVVERQDICFKQTPERDLLANVFLPSTEDWRDTVVICLHGGVWNRGDRSFFDDRCRAFAEQRIPALTTDYRLSGEATYPAAVRDVKSAVRWIRHEEPFGITPRQIVLCGHSAGAHLAALTGATAASEPTPDDEYENAAMTVDGLVCFDGPYDLLGAKEHGETAVFMGGSPTEIPERYREASPRERVTSAHPPTLLYLAEDDEWLTMRETRAYRDVLNIAGVDVELRTPPGDHFFFTENPWFERTVNQTVTFIERIQS
ncbi:alpha/beta hydrolase [Natronorubrum texcoconense]|uniref:Acetyl esterase/lipase n=1 Tax=Natronorubrum texcoconense TaxID=1095776 RepID=A0A1G9E5U2_9EURY|nr:alpha/beta hydrolase [Natronorubrum texcoconense]SDK71463.1 Acetyl esterase/lipase [Natronorubrum texcoconense]